MAGKDASALVRIQVNNCTAMTQGTGFFVGPDTVVTSGHLFDKASSISVHSASGVVRGALLERDAATGVAVVKVLPTGDGGKLTGAPLPVSAKDPQPSSPVRMLGLPTGRDAHQAKGTVKALDQQATVAENSLSGLVSHDANAQPGVSGAPLLDAAGKVVAMELSTTDDGAGEQHAVPAQAISTVIKQAGSAKPQKLAKCVESGPPSMTSIHPDAPAIKTALTRYLWGLSHPTEIDETGPMPRLEQFGTFYASARVLPFARTAHRAGSLSDEGMRAVERVCERLMSGDFDDQQPPSRIHGDLWAGNVVFTRQGAVLVDAAAHGGHAETDLAMLDLFGAPHLERIQAAWQEACSPADGWRERTALHQLHPLLVHAVLFGGSYGARAQRVAQHFA